MFISHIPHDITQPIKVNERNRRTLESIKRGTT